MIDIRPESDLREHLSDIKDTVTAGDTVFLTENGYGSMVIMSVDTYSMFERSMNMQNQNDRIRKLFRESYEFSVNNPERMTEKEVFGTLVESYDEL